MAALPFQKWFSIDSFAHLVRNLRKICSQARIVFKLKPKLHGTNAAVSRCQVDGVVHYGVQSRNRMISPGDDNAGFAQWALSNVQDLFPSEPPEGRYYIFGEWVGSGIVHGNTACQKLENRNFFPFCIAVMEGDEVYFIYDPEGMKPFINEKFHGNILPWVEKDVSVDLSSETSIRSAEAYLNEVVNALEENDPHVEALTGIKAPGEGFVAYPAQVITREGDPIRFDSLGELMFKVKTAEHRAAGTKAASVTLPNLTGVSDFVAQFVTPARLQQGLDTLSLQDKPPKSTGAFIHWIQADVEKESIPEREVLGVPWQTIATQIAIAARKFYLGR